ncbi:MAG: ATP synthase gamma chain [Candidatus Falkowbacteria bacterium GW2011_GWF2_43_32]|nr:MAG: ATP synthase gamma chain [Candidatus Falkowbacteria bacterium GW2011_GWF2_43_32]
MEMVAAAKMRRAVEAVLKTRTYANLSWMTILNIARSLNSGSERHPLLTPRPENKRTAIVLVSSNRGLCGGFNTALISKAIKSLKKYDSETDFIVIGKKGLAVQNRFGYNVVAEFPKADVLSDSTAVSPIASMIIKEFLSGRYDKVLLAYSDFVNAVKQVPRIKQLLPVDIDSEDEYLGAIGTSEKLATSKEMIKQKEEKYLQTGKNKFIFTYEPEAEEVLEAMVPRLVEVQIFQALLESNASEHSARMAAMHQATDAAGDLVDELTLFYNKARQASITAEISEISAGVLSLSS